MADSYVSILLEIIHMKFQYFTSVFRDMVIISLKVYSHISHYVPVTDMQQNLDYK
jgi:hypothetical protein